MERKFFLVAVAGGSGLRMGAQMPKQFLPLGGKPILRRTIERFLDACPDAKVVTVLPDSHMDWWKNYCLENGFTVPQVLVKGGFTRFHSVRNALERIPEGAIVAVHDGVRPFVSADLIRSMRDKMASCPALIPVVPCTDTLKAVLTLGSAPVEVQSVSMDFFFYPLSWIFLPQRVAMDVSDDGRQWRRVGEWHPENPEILATPDIKTFRAEVKGTARYIRVVADPLPEIPAWHRAAGQKAWIFTDEIVVK